MTEAKWRLYEAVVADLEEAHDERCRVIFDHHVAGQRSGVQRQVDVWLEAEIGGLNHGVTVAVECRNYTTTKLGIKDVDAFCGFLDDLGANKGVLVTTSSFTGGAEKRAAGANIETRVLTLDEAMEFEWSEWVAGDRCEAYGCDWGHIGWSYFEHPNETYYGECDTCGQFHIHCGFCGVVESYDEAPVLRCRNDDCRAVFTLMFDSGMVEGIEASLDESAEAEDEEEA